MSILVNGTSGSGKSELCQMITVRRFMLSCSDPKLNEELKYLRNHHKISSDDSGTKQIKCSVMRNVNHKFKIMDIKGSFDNSTNVKEDFLNEIKKINSP